MAEARFIKTVTFGGFDRAEVIRRLEYLNTQVYDLRNELRETKLMLEAYKKGTDVEKASEAVIAGERTKLTQLQVQNDTLNTKLKASDEENKNYVQQVKDLNAEIERLNEELKNAEAKVTALNSHNEAMALSNVFIEAQKSASMLEGTARAKAAEIEDQAKRAAEQTVSDANDEAAQIIYEAERTAAEKLTEAKNSAEEMNVASNNLRASMVNDVANLSEQLETLRNVLEAFRDNGLDKLDESSMLLSKVEATLNEGGVPRFKDPVHYEAELPEKPARKEIISEEERQRKQNELEKLKQMAEAIGGAKKPETDENKNAEPKNTDAKTTESKPAKGGKIDLAALAAKANSLNKK